MISDWGARPYFVVGGEVFVMIAIMVPRQGTVNVEPTGGVEGAGADALIHSSNLLDLQRNFAVIARCFSLLFPGGNGQESRISAVKGRSLGVIFRIISGI